MTIYLGVVGGVLLSVILPLIRAFLPKPPERLVAATCWEKARPFVATGAFSLLVALLVVAGMGDKLDSWRTALIAGYLWDSTLQKMTTGNLAAAI